MASKIRVWCFLHYFFFFLLYTLLRSFALLTSVHLFILYSQISSILIFVLFMCGRILPLAFNPTIYFICFSHMLLLHLQSNCCSYSYVAVTHIVVPDAPLLRLLTGVSDFHGFMRRFMDILNGGGIMAFFEFSLPMPHPMHLRKCAWA